MKHTLLHPFVYATVVAIFFTNRCSFLLAAAAVRSGFKIDGGFGIGGGGRASVVVGDDSVREDNCEKIEERET